MTAYALGRIPQHDPRNAGFPVRSIVGARAPRSYTWGMPRGLVLNQGREGACVGFAFAAELAARPAVVPGITDEVGRRIYREAQQNDPWPGQEPEFSGTSVLAGVQVLQRMGYVSEYRWAFGAAELAAAVSWVGPCVIGIDWHDSMYAPGPDGFIRPTGSIVGGHAILIRGYNVRARRFLAHNSWGSGFGGKGGAPAGCAWLSFDDAGDLLGRQWADACVPLRRSVTPER